ncbi:hypothetical protein BN12_20012 [Nostocoides japonicum T1-X7]|uniref:SnoaL-like domain-containing protein n=1 Tax=Nostocoides japonicum T1-X7 TaxID=1194083 RepID=A0A077LZU4_9MICO|nr:nuclear transport factor 2 family protein [Tetrasphaera japonica]CCH77469.1 hypothetical protein BN12_20012 [Tetrasphaera japonica T1-X7]
MSRDARAVWLAYNEAENSSDYPAMMALIAPDLAVTVNGRPAVSSAEDDERAMRALKQAYPDYRRDVEEVIGAGDRAVARWRMIGSPASPDLAPLDVPGCSVVRTVGEVMVEAYLYHDGAALDAVLEAAGATS